MNGPGEAWAGVAELADAQDLGSCGATRGGSSPPLRTVQTSKGYIHGSWYRGRRSLLYAKPETKAMTPKGIKALIRKYSS